jgi:T-complex protein 1 subunit delta
LSSCAEEKFQIQKSILRDAVSDLALHFLDKIKCMVIKDIEREDVEFICKSLGCRPIASLDHFTADNLVTAELVEEIGVGGNRMVKITGEIEENLSDLDRSWAVSGAHNAGKTVTLLVRGSNKLVLEEADRSLHDALCVIRCLVRKKALIAGGGVPEIELALKLAALADKKEGIDAICLRAYANALEIIPFTLAENAGLNPIQVC